MRPGYLELNEGEPGTFEVVWKQPRRGALLLLLDPALPEHCTETARQAPEYLAGALVERWTVECETADGDPDRIFHGDTVAVAGLERTLTDVLLRMSFANGDTLTELLRPENPSVTVDREAASNALPYFRLGVEHLVFGFDHMAVGAELARQWRLPECLRLCIEFHHEPFSATDCMESVLAVHLANSVAVLAELDSDSMDDAPPVDERAFRELGVGEDTVREVVEETQAAVTELLRIFVN